MLYLANCNFIIWILFYDSYWLFTLLYSFPRILFVSVYNCILTIVLLKKHSLIDLRAITSSAGFKGGRPPTNRGPPTKPLNFLPARRYASAGNRDRNVSVRPSVTRRYCVETKKASVMISSPSGSPKTLAFWRQISSPNSKGFPPNRDLKQGLDCAVFYVPTNTV